MLVLFIGCVFLLVLLYYGNLNFAKQNDAGVDFLIRWLPGRLVLFERYDSPYSLEATHQIQYFRYGRLAYEWEMQGLFSYPHYTIFIMLPLIAIPDFTIARALWMTILEVAHIGIVILTLRFTNFNPRPVSFLLMVIVSLISSYLLQPIIDANPSSLAAIFIVLSLFFLSIEKDIAAGIFLALATFKPQMTIFYFLLVFLWAYSQKRWKIIISSMAGLIALFSISFLFQPDWFFDFVKQIMTYPEYASPNTPATILGKIVPGFEKGAGLLLAIVSFGLILYEWVRAYGKGFRHFLWTTCFTFALLPLSGIVFGNRNFIILLPGFLLFFIEKFRTYPARTVLWNGLLILMLILSWSPLFFTFVDSPFLSFNNYLPLSFLLVLLMYFTRAAYTKQREPGGNAVKTNNNA